LKRGSLRVGFAAILTMIFLSRMETRQGLEDCQDP
jgi:hypothetical protein